jgi:CRP-like cAMP-binding protein
MDAAAAIAASTLFRGLTPAQCEPFVSIARERHIPAGEYIFRLGQEATSLFVVCDGVVELAVPLKLTGDDRDVVVEEAREGDTVAWSALVDPHRFTMSGRAGTDVVLIGFPRRDLQSMLAVQSDAGVRIMTNLAQVIGRRLHVVQTLWNRELQRTVSETFG